MVLITGGTGVMGSALVKRLLAKGERVRVLTLPGDPQASRVEAMGAEIRYGDVSDESAMHGICEGVDTVYHLAAIIIAFDPTLYEKINVGGTRNVLSEAKRNGVSHFIHISSASVVYRRPTAYSLSKRVCEKLVRDSGIPYTIVRPTLVYDKGRGAEEFDSFLAYLDAFPIVPFIGKGTAVKRPVFVEDIIDGLVAIHGNPKARGNLYNLSGGEPITMEAFARLCLALQGNGAKKIVHLPVWLCIALSKVMKYLMKKPPLRWPVIAGVIQDADLDPSEAERDLGYHPSDVSEQLPCCFPRYSIKKGQN